MINLEEEKILHRVPGLLVYNAFDGYLPASRLTIIKNHAVLIHKGNAFSVIVMQQIPIFQNFQFQFQTFGNSPIPS